MEPLYGNCLFRANLLVWKREREEIEEEIEEKREDEEGGGWGGKVCYVWLSVIINEHT